MVILVDDEDRENEGDLVVAGELVEPAHIRFMANEARGLICLALSQDRADALGLEPMVRQNTAPLGTAFTRSIDHREHRGMGAAARAATIRAAVDPASGPADFTTPGHVFPLRARRGGVLVRTGQTEGSVDLARLAGLSPAGVICEVMNPDGTMARLPELLAFGSLHDIPVVTVADLIAYRLRHERLVTCVSRALLPTAHGDFLLRCYENTASGQVHVALSIGEPWGDASTLVRVHRADTVADVFGLDLLTAQSRLARALGMMAAEGAGVLLYLRPDADDEPLDARVAEYAEPTDGSPTPRHTGVAMGFHDFGIGAQILHDIGVRKIRVITGQPRTFKGLSGYDLEITGWVPLEGDAEAGT
ncbi:MAG: 3,4-dihydroxy-2-butanone-4-phosphate synthase [Deltaproteobacteria bacterium]|nr:3,4-dihydroxy-2-butanone-4-phosphate synthase [Deltaproteobacteria bacterium]MCB9785870.1 3,4-dihydroxy-2-butanone-4-phosphate synthase [Deltaproteobacteria bacterium]